MLRVFAAETDMHFQQVRELFAELAAFDTALMRELGIDPRPTLEFHYTQNEEKLPGVYAAPAGRLLLATYGAKTAGCAAFRRVAPDICEMKRMYVRPEYRGKQIGRKLADTLIQMARQAGYGVMRLETTTYLEKAIALYAALGFRECQPYYSIPEPLRMLTIFMELNLADVTSEQRVRE